MTESVISGDLVVRGRVVPQQISLPADCVQTGQVPTGANLSQSKLQHRHTVSRSQNGTAAAETRSLYRAVLPGTVLNVIVGSIAAAIGDSTVTVDIKKNGTTILSSPVTLNSSNTARVGVAATLSGTPALVAGDWLETVVTVSAGTGTLPTGLFIQVQVSEDGV